MGDVTPVRSGALGRLGLFFDLGKLGIVELWLGFFVGVSLVGRRAVTDVRAASILALTLVSSVAVFALTCSLDDIAGVRDGVDQANHRGSARRGVSKPILDGRLTERRALSFVHVLAAVTAVGFGGVIALAWPLPGWVVAMMACVVLLAASYSYGLKLSYHGAGELVVFAACAGTVLVPQGLIERTPSAAAVFSAVLVGSWNAQVVVFSNSQDAEGDRRAGRRTIAARTSRRGNRVYITSVFLFFWALTAAALVSGVVPVAYGVALAPVWALQVYQLWIGVRHERWLCARLLGFRVVRLGVAALVMVTVLWCP